MKILVCVSEYPPQGSGIAQVAFRMVTEFQNRGHQCVVCSPTGPDIRLGSDTLIRRVAGLGLLHYWWNVKTRFAHQAPYWDVVWLHWPMFLSECPFKAALVTFHGTYRGFHGMLQGIASPWYIKQYYAFMEQMEKRSLQHLQGNSYLFSAVSPQAIAELDTQGVDRTRVAYVPVGVDTERFHTTTNAAAVRAELGIAQEALVLLYVGRLSRPKNLFALVDTFAELKKTMQHAGLVIVGSGELEKQLARHIDSKNVDGVRLMGFIPNQELPRVYGCADFFIMSSSYEGQPVVLLEAMASGLPPILSDIPALRSVVEESSLGLLVDFTDPSRAAQRIQEYISSPKAQKDRSAVREYVMRNLSSAACAEKYLELLQRASGIGTKT